MRNAHLLESDRHYGPTFAPCVLADPASRGGSENAVRIAEADLAPTDANLPPFYGSSAELEAACWEFCERINARRV